MERYEAMIRVCKELGEELQNESCVASGLELARLNKEILENSFRLENLELHLNARLEYFNTTFLPQYEKDMEEAETYFEPYLERAREMSVIDTMLAYAIKQWEEKYKEAEERRWEFYTTIRDRVDQNIVQFEKQGIDAKLKHLIVPIRDERSPKMSVVK